MRALTKVILITAVLLTNQMFSQTNNNWELKPDNQSQEKIIPYSISDEQINHPSKSDIFKNEIATLVKEEKPVGSYEVEFNPVSSIRHIFLQIISRKFYRNKENGFIKITEEK